MSNKAREQVIETIRRMRENTVGKGCTPGEAAKFATMNVPAKGWLPKELRTCHYRGPGESPVAAKTPAKAPAKKAVKKAGGKPAD